MLNIVKMPWKIREIQAKFC